MVVPFKLGAKQLVCGYEQVVLNRASFQLEPGKITGVIGQNGSGKSTLGLILAGLNCNYRGRIILDQQPLKPRVAARLLQHETALVFQNPDHSLLFTRVRDDFEFILQNFQVSGSSWGERIQHALSIVGLEKFLDANPYELSGGERQRLAIALAIVRDPACLIYDEATSMLDTDARTRIYQILQDLKTAHKTQLWITHNLDELLVVDNVLVLANQTIKQYTRAEILHQPKILVQAGLKPTLVLELVYQLQKRGHEVQNLADLQREIHAL